MPFTAAAPRYAATLDAIFRFRYAAMPPCLMSRHDAADVIQYVTRCQLDAPLSRCYAIFADTRL